MFSGSAVGCQGAPPHSMTNVDRGYDLDSICIMVHDERRKISKQEES